MSEPLMSRPYTEPVMSRGLHVDSDTKNSAVEFVCATEKEITRVLNHIPKSKKRMDVQEIVVTDKRVYVSRKTGKESSEKIIDIDTVQYVDFSYSKQKNKHGSSSLFYIMFGFLLLAIGLPLGIAVNKIFYIIAGLGALPIITGLIFGRKIPRHDLILGSTINPIIIVVDRMSKEDVRSIQKAVFTAIDANKRLF